MQNRPGLLYTMLLIDCCRHTHGEIAVSKSSAKLSSMRLQPKITKIQKIQQGMKNKDERKEARYRQLKQWLIMLNRLPEKKSEVQN